MTVPPNKNRIEVSADAAERVQTALAWVRAFPRDAEILVVAHSAAAAIDFQLHLVSATGSWFGLKRLTLNTLAAQLAQQALAQTGSAPASNLSFTAIVARAIHTLQATGKLNYFAPVATRPGFPAAVAGTLAELRINEIDPDEVKIASLTEREREVIALIAEGLKNKQIGQRLFISETTVTHHLSSIFSKLGVSDRLELVIFAFSRNLAKMPQKTSRPGDPPANI